MMHLELAIAVVVMVFCWAVKLTMQPGYEVLGVIMKLVFMVLSTWAFLEVFVRWFKMFMR